MARTPALAVVAKYPRPGAVKTRLGAEIGMERSAQLYYAFLLDLRARFSDLPYARYWAYPPGDDDLAGLFDSPVLTIDTGSANLAQALANVFRSLGRAGHDPIVVISSDSPQLPLDCIHDAFRALRVHDIVLGPTEDGGYYLVGQRRPLHDVFTPITMSTTSVFEQTLALCRAAGLSVSLLPPAFDVDEVDDLRRLETWLCRTGRAELPATRALLAEWSGEAR